MNPAQGCPLTGWEDEEMPSMLEERVVHVDDHFPLQTGGAIN